MKQLCQSTAAAIALILAAAGALGSEVKVINITDFSCQDVLSTTGLPSVIDRCSIEVEIELDALDMDFPIDYVCWFDLKVRVNTNLFESRRSEVYEDVDMRSWVQFTASKNKVKLTTVESFKDLRPGKDQIVWARLTGAMCVEKSAFERQNPE